MSKFNVVLSFLFVFLIAGVVMAGHSDTPGGAEGLTQDDVDCMDCFELVTALDENVDAKRSILNFLTEYCHPPEDGFWEEVCGRLENKLDVVNNNLTLIVAEGRERCNWPKLE